LLQLVIGHQERVQPMILFSSPQRFPGLTSFLGTWLVCGENFVIQTHNVVPKNWTPVMFLNIFSKY